MAWRGVGGVEGGVSEAVVLRDEAAGGGEGVERRLEARELEAQVALQHGDGGV